MNKGNQLYVVNQLRMKKKEDIFELVQDWLILIRILFEPTFMQFDTSDHKEFSLEEVNSFLKEVAHNEYFMLSIGNSENVFTIQRSKANLLEKLIIDQELFAEQQTIINDYQMTRLSRNGIYGYARSHDEYLYNNTESIQQRKIFESPEQTEKLPKMLNNQGETLVDCNHLPGFDLFYDGLCLTSCWRMFFTKYYYRIILKQILLDIQQVELIEELDNDLLMIELYRDPTNWDHPANLKFQQFFRDQMGFDQLVWNNGVGILKDPYIEYAERGKAIQTVQYQNSRLQPIEKKQATHFVTRYYDDAKQIYREKRMFGLLNSQAYFPWVDENHLTMMNYKILNPQMTIDEGINAYEYYIRNHLEIDVKDENYENYTAILKLYIPENVLTDLPIEKIRTRLSDIKISRTKKQRGGIRLDLQKGRNHLTVVFLSQQKLEKLENNKATE